MNAETHGWKFRGLALPALDGFLPLEDGRYAVALTPNERPMSPRRLQLDYVAPPRAAARWPGSLVLAAAIAIAGVLFERHRDARLALERIEARQGMLDRARAPVRAVPRERLDEEAKSAQAAVRQLALPWARHHRHGRGRGDGGCRHAATAARCATAHAALDCGGAHAGAMLEYLRTLGCGEGSGRRAPREPPGAARTIRSARSSSRVQATLKGLP